MKKVASLSSAESKLELAERLSSLRPNDAALWGRMTAPQMIRHLVCSCEVASGERSVAPVKGLPQPIMKWIALRSNLRWPKNVKSTPELAQIIEQDTLGSDEPLFHEGVATAIARLDLIAEGRQWAPSHPFFGSMTPQDWMRWAYLHTDHHLRQFGR
jgi:hypothetical protein